MRAVMGRIFRGLAVLAALLATMQPLLGSFAFFRRGDPLAYETMHLVTGGILYNVAILLGVAALLTRLCWRRTLFALCLVQYALVHIQLRLGLGANTDLRLLAYHIPLGVLIFFVAYLMVALAFGLRLGEKNRESVKT